MRQNDLVDEALEQRSVIAGYQRELDEVEQTLGKALGFPWFKDDQKNFPGSTEANGVCIGPHTAGTLAQEVAEKLADLAYDVKIFREVACAILADYPCRGTRAASAAMLALRSCKTGRK